MVSKNFPIIGDQVAVNFGAQRLPKQQYDLLKTPLILALSAYNSKMSLVTPIFYYQIVISMIRCNFLQSLKKFYEGGFRATFNFRKFKVALNPLRRMEMKFQRMSVPFASPPRISRIFSRMESTHFHHRQLPVCLRSGTQLNFKGKPAVNAWER